MKEVIEFTIRKSLEVPETTIFNVIVDGLLSNNYSFAVAQNIAENVLAGTMFCDQRKKLCLSRALVIDAIKRYCSRNTDIEIEMFSDSANEVFEILKDNYNIAVV